MGYHYVKTYEIGLVSDTRTPEAVMGMLQAQPNAFFPFKVVGPGSSDRFWTQSGNEAAGASIQLGATYNLQNVRLADRFASPGAALNHVSPGPDAHNHVVVSQVRPRSFSFYALADHFDRGGVITFTTFARDGYVYLQQEGNAPSANILNSIGVTACVWRDWRIQAENLATAAQYPETLALGQQFINDQHFGSVTVDMSQDTGSTMVIGPITVDASAKTDSAKTIGPITVDESTETGSTMVIGPITTESTTPRGAGQESQTSAH